MQLDHIIVGAATLDQGREYIRDVLGADVPVGGRHDNMGTHNRLMSLGGGDGGKRGGGDGGNINGANVNGPRVNGVSVGGASVNDPRVNGASAYFEIMAIDLELPDPGRPRWVSLDDPDMRARLSERPRLIAWVARSNDLAATREAALSATGIDLGVVSDMQRGDFRWRMAIPDDGALKEGGCLPLGIEWQGDAHPTDTLADLGVRLQSLTLHHPDPENLRRQLAGMGALGEAKIVPGDAPALTARLTRADGTGAVLD